MNEKEEQELRSSRSFFLSSYDDVDDDVDMNCWAELFHARISVLS